MSNLYYGSFEAILRSHIVPQIPKEKLSVILLSSPVFDARDNDIEDKRMRFIVEPTTLSKYRRGKRKIAENIYEKFAGENALERVKYCFYVDVIPKIPERSRQDVINEVLSLIKEDPGLSEQEKTMFEELATIENIADFLAEVLCFAVNATPPNLQKVSKANEPAHSGKDSKTTTTITTHPPAPVRPGWGDNGGARPSYTLAQINGGILGDTIVFNSISDSVIGDEKFFVGVRRDEGDHHGPDNVWGINYITARHEAVYLIRLYIHNNNPGGLRAIAKNVQVAIDIPESSAKDLLVSGFIESSNAIPSKYWASVVFHSEVGNFHLEYIYGSARLENNGLGQYRSIKLSDYIVTKASTGGVFVDFDTLDGSVPGGYTYDSFVGIRVKAVFDTEFLVAQEVRLADTIEWQDTIDVKIGDTAELQIHDRNFIESLQDNVMVRAILPAELEYIPRSTRLFSDIHPNGVNIIEDDVAMDGINIGGYGPNANAFVRFSAKVVATPATKAVLKSWARVTVNETLLQDCTAITVLK